MITHRSLLKLSLLEAKSRHFQRSTAGYTLIEMLAIMAIIAVLFSIAAPGWVTFANRQRASSIRDQVLQTIRLTQTEAKRLRSDRTLSFDTTGDVPVLDRSGVRENLGNSELRPGMIGFEAVDSQGNPVEAITFAANGSLAVESNPTTPIFITISAPPDTPTKRCVIIETILGSTRSGRDADCDI